MLRKLLFITTFFICISVANAYSSVNLQEGKHVSAQVYTNYSESEELGILVKLILHDGWHISGETVEDIGKPTYIEISPQPASIAKPIYSATEHFVFDDIIEMDGYSDVAYIYTSIKGPQTKYELKVFWTACKDSCEDESANFELDTNNPSELSEWEEEIGKSLSSFASSGNNSNEISLFYAISFAFLAGIILNIMPCIFPILSIKAVYLAQNTEHNKGKRYLNGFMYLCGVVLSFWIIATLLYALRSNGHHIGWGFQLQSPWFVSFMIVLFTFIFLLFMDIITLPPAFHRFSQSNSFVTGFFAVLIASPCSGPFMGVAIGYALLQPLYLYYPIFTALALGYALPFTLADMFPRFVAKILPKSGRWMFYAKRILAIPVLMTVLWLIWIFVAQVSHDTTTEQSMWQDYNPTKIEQLRAQKKPILINFTAKWCLICLMNEKTTLSKTNFLHLAKQKDIQLFKADWTNKNPLISQGLEQYGRNSIPLYIYYDKNGNYTILPQILTIDILEEYFSE